MSFGHRPRTAISSRIAFEVHVPPPQEADDEHQREVEVEDADQVQRRRSGGIAGTRRAAIPDRIGFAVRGNLTRVAARVYALRALSAGIARDPRPSLPALRPLPVRRSGAAAPADEITIVVIPKGLTHEHWQSVRRGAERCAADLLAEEGIRVRVIFDGPLRERDAMEQIRIVDRRVATGAQRHRPGPAAQPDDDRVREAGRRRRACRSSSSTPASPRPTTSSSTSPPTTTTAGASRPSTCSRNSPKQGKTKPRLILFRYAVGSESTEQREKGFEDTVKKLCPDAVWLSTDKYAGATRDSAMREAGPLVLQFKDQVDGIFAPNESSATGMLDVLRSQGLNKKVLRDGLRREQAAAAGDPGGRRRRQHPARPVPHGLPLDVVLRAAPPRRGRERRPHADGARAPASIVVTTRRT